MELEGHEGMVDAYLEGKDLYGNILTSSPYLKRAHAYEAAEFLNNRSEIRYTVRLAHPELNLDTK